MLGRREIDRAAAFGRAAVAGIAAGSPAETVIDGQFFAGVNPAATEIENMAADFAGVKVGVAAVVDQLGAIAADRGVDAPMTVEAEIKDGRPAVRGRA